MELKEWLSNALQIVTQENEMKLKECDMKDGEITICGERQRIYEAFRYDFSERATAYKAGFNDAMAVFEKWLDAPSCELVSSDEVEKEEWDEETVDDEFIKTVFSEAPYIDCSEECLQISCQTFSEDDKEDSEWLNSMTAEDRMFWEKPHISIGGDHCFYTADPQKLHEIADAILKCAEWLEERKAKNGS